MNICRSHRSGAAAGYDNVSITTVKQIEAIDLIIIPQTNVTNLSTESGIVPDELKIARVIPVYKSGKDNVFSNYRPVSV